MILLVLLILKIAILNFFVVVGGRIAVEVAMDGEYTAMAYGGDSNAINQPPIYQPVHRHHDEDKVTKA